MRAGGNRALAWHWFNVHQILKLLNRRRAVRLRLSVPACKLSLISAPDNIPKPKRGQNAILGELMPTLVSPDKHEGPLHGVKETLRCFPVAIRRRFRFRRIKERLFRELDWLSVGHFVNTIIEFGKSEEGIF